MPRNINGVYALPSGNPVVPGTLIESTWANPTMSDIGNELTQSLPRNGAAPMTGPLMLFRDGLLPKEAVTLKQLNLVTNSANSYLPAGAIQVFAMSAIPTGWLECNGDTVSRTTYANLFSVIGTTYGAGNGTTTFKLPDLRGEFIRGWDNGRSVDPGRGFGTAQSGANAPHNHTLIDPGHIHAQAAHAHGVTDPGHTHQYYRDPAFGGSQGGTALAQQMDVSTVTGSSPTGISIQTAQPAIQSEKTGITVAQEGTEARPRNVAMIYCIKAYGALQQDGLGTMAFQNYDSVNITAGIGAFTSLKSATVPVDPTDVVRLADIGGTMVDVNSSDINILLVDKTNPNIPILRPQTNVPFGTVKLDANGKVPNALMSAQTATGTSFTPTGTIAATDVQAAIAEVAGEALGVGQTWQSVTRVSATNYINTTGRPIMMYVRTASSSTATIVIDGLTLPTIVTTTVQSGNLSLIIPPGSVYQITCAAAFSVVELR